MRGSMEDLKFLPRPKSLKNHTPIKTWVTGTHPTQLEIQHEIIELYIYYGLSQTKIAELVGCDRKQVWTAIKKYYPKQGEHDIVMSIMSKV